MKEKKKTIGLSVEEKFYNQAQDLADREGWSLRQVSEKALKNYLKLRGYRDENTNSSK